MPDDGKIKARIVGNQKVKNRLARFEDELRYQIPDALDVYANDVQGEAYRLLMRLSNRRPRGRRHGPSPAPPGFPPAHGEPPTRALSLRRHDAVPDGTDRWTASVGSSLVYSRIQELGGLSGRGHRTALPPRPYLAWAADNVITVLQGRVAFAEAVHNAWLDSKR
jgi:hypothetical protein